MESSLIASFQEQTDFTDFSSIVHSISPAITHAFHSLLSMHAPDMNYPHSSMFESHHDYFADLEDHDSDHKVSHHKVR